MSIKAVDGVSLTVDPSETVGLVGESGCGKTTLGRAIVGLVKPAEGWIRLHGKEVTGLTGHAAKPFRRMVQMVFQDPYASLDPRMTAAQIVGEALEIHGLGSDQGSRRRRVDELLCAVGMDAGQGSRFPHEFSGGQRQRIGIARALAVEPQLIVCDEPVSALDVSIQAQIINLLQDLQEQRGIAYLFVAHDLAVVEHISRRILVMYLGKIVERGESSALCGRPLHPYTQALLSAVPVLESESPGRRILLCGSPPSPADPPKGCPFHPRCPIAESRCRTEVPVLREVLPGHWVSCHLADGTGTRRSDAPR
jgi:oligopeptide/dipeptide ABC transporter ATP-binding protein